MKTHVYSADPQYSSAVINTNVIVRHTGEVVWLSHGIFRSSCDIDVEFFPFDEQRCVLKWASWTYDGYQVNDLIIFPCIYTLILSSLSSLYIFEFPAIRELNSKIYMSFSRAYNILGLILNKRASFEIYAPCRI